MPPSDVTPALDESWASLDASDFSHDDDLQSENADTASLIDLSSTNDAESAVEDEIGSDVDLDEDRATSMVVGQSIPDREEKDCEEQRRNDEDMEDTIILQRSETQPHPNTVDLEYSRLLPSPLANTHNMSNLPATQETISMTVSKSSLVLSARPFNVAYYGAASAHETKDELLGKIGAALVTSSSTGSPRSVTASPCFNIVPTEFGPGSKPAFADLIPSQAQMTVDDMTMLKPSPKSPASIRFAFKRGTVFESNPRAVGDQSTAEPWRPDLLVLQVCREDLADDFSTITEALELASRHFWPVIVVTNEPTNGLCPLDFGHGITVQRTDGVRSFKQPVDLDSFVTIDTDQLNHHIKYIITKAEERRTTAATQMRPASILQTFARALSPSTDQWRRNVGEYTLQIVEPASKPVKCDQKSIPFRGVLQQTWSCLSVRPMLNDILVGIVVILLGTYFVAFSHNVSQKISGISLSNSTSVVHSEMMGTATVTATSTMITASAIPTEVLPIDHDIVVYDPISFDQMWHRLTGRPIQNEEHPLVEEAQEEIQPSPRVANPFEQLQDPVHEFFYRWKSMLGGPIQNAHGVWETFKEGTARRRQVRRAREHQINDMHRKLQDFWSDVSKSVQNLGKHSQDYFSDLVDRSQQHIQVMSWASEQQLEKLVSEQKSILAKAQIQARLLVQQVPERKKRSFFGQP